MKVVVLQVTGKQNNYSVHALGKFIYPYDQREMFPLYTLKINHFKKLKDNYLYKLKAAITLRCTCIDISSWIHFPHPYITPWGMMNSWSKPCSLQYWVWALPILIIWKYAMHYSLLFWLENFPSSSSGKNPPAMRETWVWSLGWESPLEKGKATHSSTLSWRIPWTL